MDEFKHGERESAEEDAEARLTDLPLPADAGGKWSFWLARCLLGWQVSFRQRRWRQIGPLATLLLTVLAAHVMFGPLQRSLTSSPAAHPGLSPDPSIATYRSHPVLTYRGHFGAVRGEAWSPDGRRIASGSSDGTVEVWNAVTGQRILTYRGDTQFVLPAVDTPRAVLSIAWSPDGKRIASSGRLIRVWDASTGRDSLTYEAHSDRVWAVAWSPDGKFIASGSADGTLQIWNATTGKRLLTYPGSAFCLAWSPDGKRIVSGGEHGSVKVWQAV
jgi:WD40 repeat protein